MAHKNREVTFIFTLGAEAAEQLIEIVRDEENRNADLALDGKTPFADRGYHAGRAAEVYQIRLAIQQGSKGLYQEKESVDATSVPGDDEPNVVLP